MNNEPKIPSSKKDWQAIDIFLFSNGQQYSPPRKYHLRSEELNWWNATLGYLARSQYGSKHALLNLYTLKGKAVKGPLELINGVAYVAVLPEDSFIDAGYEKYVIKASRSWEKRQSKISNILSPQSTEVKPQVIETEDVEKDEAPRESYLLDATDTAKTIEDTNILETPVVNAKSEENITIILPNTLKNFDSIKSVEKKRPKSYPIKRPTVERRTITSSPISKIPLKRGVSPIKSAVSSPVSNPVSRPVSRQTTSVKSSSERNNINSAQTKPVPIPRSKTPFKPIKLQSDLVASRNITLPPLVEKKIIPKNAGQTTDVPHVDNIDGKDIIFLSDLNEFDISSSIVDANSISMNRTQNKEPNSLDVVSKETKNKNSDLPVIKELTNSTSGKILFTPANTKVKSLDSTNSLSKMGCVEHVNNPASNTWSNSAKQVPTSEDLSMNNKLKSAHEIPSSDQQQNPGMANDNVKRPVPNNDTLNINITFTEPDFRNFSELPDKSAKEPLMVLVNKGDIISLKLNLEVRNAEGVLNTVLNTDTVQTGAKDSHANNKSRVSIHDDGKSIHSNAGDDRPHVCCPGNTVVVRCACCNCYQYQTEASGNDSKPINNNDPKNYFVVVPVLYGNERFINSSGIARFEKGNQNPASLTKLNTTCSIKEPFILAPAKAQENRPEPDMIIQEIPNQNGNDSEVLRICFDTKNERNETTNQTSKLPDVKALDSILVKHNITQTLCHVGEQHVPAMVFHPKKQLEHKSTQSEWHNVLMELRSAEDGHYTFHLPSLSTLRRYNVPPFE